MRPRRLYERLQDGQFQNVRFEDFVQLLEALGFEKDRQQGSHQVFRHRVVPVRMVVQPLRGMAKPYQLRQLLACVEEFGLQWDANNG